MKIGITGGIASGKTLVSNMLQDLGFSVVDADQIAKEVVKLGMPAYQQIVERFGNEILDSFGEINRKQLAAIIFKDADARKALNEITHPIIRAKMLDIATKIEKSEGIVFLDIPLLFESGYEQTVDKTIVVYVPYEIQLDRLMKRDSIDEVYAKDKMESQMSLELKKDKADFLIDNSGTTSCTKNQLIRVIAELKGE